MKLTAKQNGNQTNLKISDSWLIWSKSASKCHCWSRRENWYWSQFIILHPSFYYSTANQPVISAFIHLCPSLVFCFGSKMKILMGSMTGTFVPVPTHVKTLAAILLWSFSHNLPIQGSSGTWISPDRVHLDPCSRRRRDFDQGQSRIVPDDGSPYFCLLILSHL